MCALDAVEITAVSFLGEVGEEAHGAPSKMSASKAIAGRETSALLPAPRAQPQPTSEIFSLSQELLRAPQELLLGCKRGGVWFPRMQHGCRALGNGSTVPKLAPVTCLCGVSGHPREGEKLCFLSWCFQWQFFQSGSVFTCSISVWFSLDLSDQH